jgi:hypothetical protein
MAQFTIYSSSDAGAGNPGLIAGTAGDLLRVLDLVLVNGYTGKAAAGWTKPFANSGNIGCYKNASTANGGLGFGVAINDNGPNVTSTYQEAWATGWETVSGIGAPVGTGSGQFPTAAQLLTTGHVVVRKSNVASGAGRAWICFADALTFYLFVLTTDAAGVYQAFFFGDFFSLGGSSDSYRGMIFGRANENSTGAATTTLACHDSLGQSNLIVNPILGLYAPRTSGGGGSSIQCWPAGALGLCSVTSATTSITNVGTVQVPNGADNAYYLPPIWLMQVTVNQLRGRFRGLYHSAHPLATWTDGQVVSGASDYAGKTLQAVVKGVNSGMWFVETSNTLETN